MLGRIFTWVFFGFLVLAFILSFAGIREVHMGTGFRSWLEYVDTSYNNWKLSIPKIPDIPLLSKTTDALEQNDNSIIGVLKNVLNAIIKFINVLVMIINFIVVVVNVLIQILQFILTMVYCVGKFGDYLGQGEWALYGDEDSIFWWQDIEDIIESIHDGTFFNARMIN